MVRKGKNELVANLQKEGLVFSEMQLVHEGEYETFDADWNYKDVPHLHHLHQLVEAYPSFISDESIATINMQKILGINFPVSVFNYHSGHNKQTYYTTLFFFVMIIETSWEKLAPLKTRVTTAYSFGSKPIFKFLHPIIRFLVKRNYDDLMTEDIPMRDRRGQLRKWGYTFKSDVNPHSYIKTMRINDENVVAPPRTPPSESSLNLKELLPQDGEYLVGVSDHYGLKLIRSENTIRVFPRLCAHEGACLDKQKLQNSHIKCPWHGKILNPIFTFDIFETIQFAIRTHQFYSSAGILKIYFLQHKLEPTLTPVSAAHNENRVF